MLLVDHLGGAVRAVITMYKPHFRKTQGEAAQIAVEHHFDRFQTSYQSISLDLDSTEGISCDLDGVNVRGLGFDDL